MEERRRALMVKENVPWSGNVYECSVVHTEDVNGYSRCVLKIPNGAVAVKFTHYAYSVTINLYACNSWTPALAPVGTYETIYSDSGIYVTPTCNIPLGYSYIIFTGNRGRVANFTFLEKNE